MAMMRCNGIAFAVALLVGAPVLAAAQSLSWARRAGGVDIDGGTAIGKDPVGNTYVTGTFAHSLVCAFCGTSAVFGAGEANEMELVTTGGSIDVFVTKYNGDGMLLWARGAGGPSHDAARGLAADVSGNSYVTGFLGRGTDLASFGNGVTISFPVPNPDWGHVFLVKYDTNGAAQWARALDLGEGWGTAIDNSGNIYVVGASPDPIAGGGLITVWKVGSNGTTQWTRQVPGLYSTDRLGVAAAPDNNIFITGRLQSGDATFGPGEPTETTLSDNDQAGEQFLAKYDASGNLQWARQTADASGLLAYAAGVSTDQESAAYISGNGTTVLGLGETTETAVSGTYVAKYDGNGNLVWARSASGNGSAIEGNAITTHSSGYSYITGFFTTTATFGAGEANETLVSSLAGFQGGDIFIARYNADGSFAWVRQAGGVVPGFDFSLGIAMDAQGHASVTGSNQSAATFGPGETNESVLTGDAWDIFVASYRNDAAIDPALDLDISNFRATARVSLSSGRAVEISITVRNSGSVDSPAAATVIGMQNGIEVYRQVLVVADNVGNGQARFDFPAYVPTAAGDITWTATIADGDPDNDQTTASTRVVN